jgi:UDP-N-acetylglucosamine 2-epimerase (non-hydrolysing)
MAAALAAFYKQIPVAHIEAGLRTNDIYSPWPEEMNRRMTGRIATYHLAPTELSRQNLLKENIDNQNIIITGNTVIDALFWVVNKIKNDNNLAETLKNNIKENGYDVERQKKIVLITGHRRENFGEGFKNICNAIRTLSIKYPNVDFVYPMHLNPNVRKPISEIFGIDVINKNHDVNVSTNTFFIEPLDYLNFIFLMEKADIILTDSGGIQEEAPSLGKPVLVMRNNTERPEALDAGTVKLVGTDYDKIVNEVSELLDNENSYKKMSQAVNPYGDGLACERIVNFMKNI